MYIYIYIYIYICVCMCVYIYMCVCVCVCVCVCQWCSRGHTQVYAVCLLFSSGCLRITTSNDQYLRIPSVYPLVLLLRKSVIYCSFPYNGVPYSCVKLVILCCNWCIITSQWYQSFYLSPLIIDWVRVSAALRELHSKPLLFFTYEQGEPTGHREHRNIPGGSVTKARKSSPTLGTVFKQFYSELQKANTPKVWIGAMQSIRQPRLM